MHTPQIPYAVMSLTVRGLALFVLLVIGLGGCSSESPMVPPDEPEPPATKRARGFGLSPRGFPSDFGNTTNFFDEVEGLGRGVVMANTLWRDDAEEGTDGARSRRRPSS